MKIPKDLQPSYESKLKNEGKRSSFQIKVPLISSSFIFSFFNQHVQENPTQPKSLKGRVTNSFKKPTDQDHS